MKHVRGMTYLCMAASLLTACGGDVKESLGLNRKAPDEFRVVSRPPLSMPPQFNLRPPSNDDGDSPIQAPADKQAESIMLGNGQDTALQPGTAETAIAPVSTGTIDNSVAESQFLKNAGADQSDPKIRDALAKEKVQAQQKQEDQSWWQILSTTEPTKKDPTVDAKKEAERIKQNKEEGKPVNEGETPETKGRDTGVLGRILDY